MSATQYVIFGSLVFVFGVMLEASISAAMAAVIGLAIIGVVVSKLSK